MNPETKRFKQHYEPLADAVARLDVDQLTREQVADALTEAYASMPPRERATGWRADLFRLLASDPLCPCAGYGEEPCPEGREIRIGMHLSSAPDGRSAAWAPRRPVVRCVSCGAKQFIERKAS